jgi:nucleoside-diphosphate-sugar epimerase
MINTYAVTTSTTGRGLGHLLIESHQFSCHTTIMTRVLLTGGSGFIAAHTLDVLLNHGHSVVTTVRTQEKADKIKESYKSYVDKGQLGFAIVPDIAQPDAFDKAVVSDPPFEAVLHTASPFHFNVTDVQKDLLDPAVIGTTGILKSIKKNAPTVKQVVITSSFAAIVNPSKGFWPGHVYSEEDWNPITQQEALADPVAGYRASKTFAEKAAWEFVEKEKPNFTLSTINPPMVYGPIIHALDSLDNMNTSNQRILAAAQGKYKDEIPISGVHFWVDVRDVAEAHVAAMEKPEAANKRFFVTAGYFSNKEMCQIIKKNFPEFKGLPSDTTPGGDYPEGSPDKGLYKFDNKRSIDILGLKYITFEQSIVDTVKSFQKKGL